MSLDSVNSSLINGLSAKSTQGFASPKTTLQNSPSISSLNLKDNVVTNKIKDLSEQGKNPFGASSNINASSEPKGSVAKGYTSLVNKLDLNRDGFLSGRELVSKMQDKNIKGNDAALVGALLKNESKIRNLSNDETTIETKGITKKDILALDQLPDTNELKSEVENAYYYSMSKINSTHSNYSGTFDSNDKLKLPTKASEVDYKDLEQGGAGDCYFLAALASLAQHHPQQIIDMIKDNKNGTYTVKFDDKAVTINAPTDTELGLYASGKAWVPIIEKAYSEYRNDTDILSKTNPYDKSGGGSIVTGRGIKDLTGNSFDTDFLKTANHDTTRQKLKAAVAGNKMMTASINNNPISKNSLGLPQGHVYTVLGYNDKTDKAIIRNPWGNTEAQDKNGTPRDGKDDGIFEVSMEELHKNFTFIAYQQ